MVLLVGPALRVAQQLGQEDQLTPLEPADRRILTQGCGRSGHEQETHRRIGRWRTDVSQRTEQCNLSLSSNGRSTLDHPLGGSFSHGSCRQAISDAEGRRSNSRIRIIDGRQKGFQAHLPLPFKRPERLKANDRRRGISLNHQLLKHLSRLGRGILHQQALSRVAPETVGAGEAGCQLSGRSLFR